MDSSNPIVDRTRCGRWTASVGNDGEITITISWTSEFVMVLNPENCITQSRIMSLDWHPDGVRLLAPCLNGNTYIINSESRGFRVFKTHQSPVRMARWNNDGEHFVTASNDGSSQVWTQYGLQLFNTFSNKHSMICTCAAFDPIIPGRIVTTGWDGWARVWECKPDTMDAHVVMSLSHRGSPINWVDYSPHGREIWTATTNGRRVGVWNADTGEYIRTHTGGYPF